MKKTIDKLGLGLLFVAVMYGTNMLFFVIGYKKFFLDSFFIASVFFFLVSKKQILSVCVFILGAFAFLFYIFYTQRINYSAYLFGVDAINIFNIILVGFVFLYGLHKATHKNINLVPVFLLVLFALEVIIFALYKYHYNQSYALIDMLNFNIKQIVKEISSLYNIESLQNGFIFQILVLLSLVLHVLFQILYILIALQIGVAFSKNTTVMLHYKKEPFNNKVFKGYNAVFLFFVLMYLLFNRVPFLNAFIGSKNILVFEVFALASFAIYGVIGFNYISKSWLRNNILLLITFIVILFVFTIYAFLFIMLLGFFISWRIYQAKEF